MENFNKKDSKVIIYDRRVFIRLVTESFQISKRWNKPSENNNLSPQRSNIHKSFPKTDIVIEGPFLDQT